MVLDSRSYSINVPVQPEAASPPTDQLQRIRSLRLWQTRRIDPNVESERWTELKLNPQAVQASGISDRDPKVTLGRRARERLSIPRVRLAPQTILF